MRYLESWLWFAVSGLIISVWHPWQGVAVIASALAFGAYQTFSNHKIELLETRLEVLSKQNLAVIDRNEGLRAEIQDLEARTNVDDVRIRDVQGRTELLERNLSELQGMRRIGL